MKNIIILLISLFVLPNIIVAEDLLDITPFVGPVKNEYALDENISIPFGSEGKRNNLSHNYFMENKYWQESIMYIYRPDGSVRTKQMDKIEGQIFATFFYEFEDEKVQKGKYSLVYEVAGKKSKKTSFTVKKLPELKGIEATIEFNKKETIQPNDKLVVTLTVKNNTNKNIKFPSFYVAGINVCPSIETKLINKTYALSYPREKLLMLDEKIKTEGHPDYYSWDNIDEFNTIELKPGQLVKKDIDFDNFVLSDNAKFKIEEDMESMWIWSNIIYHMFLGDKNGKYHEICPIRLSIEKTIEYKIKK